MAWSLAAVLALAAPAAAQVAREGAREAPQESAKETEFSFFGLRFGMSPDEVRAAFPTNPAGTDALEPRHGMMFLSFTYDYRGRLSEIRASYERPADRLRETALRQALREKFILPIGSRWRGLTVDLDENFNRAALTLVVISAEMRQEAIDHFKAEYKKALE
jgi:hypothetical protein